MNKNEIKEFIEKMEEINDIWTEEEVERVYGDRSLDDALQERMSVINQFANIIETVINR
jgi:hypothetical protein